MKTKALDCPVRKDCMEFGRCDQCEHGRRYTELRQKLANSAKKVSALSALFQSIVQQKVIKDNLWPSSGFCLQPGRFERDINTVSIPILLYWDFWE